MPPDAATAAGASRIRNRTTGEKDSAHFAANALSLSRLESYAELITAPLTRANILHAQSGGAKRAAAAQTEGASCNRRD